MALKPSAVTQTTWYPPLVGSTPALPSRTWRSLILWRSRLGTGNTDKSGCMPCRPLSGKPIWNHRSAMRGRSCRKWRGQCRTPVTVWELCWTSLGSRQAAARASCQQHRVQRLPLPAAQQHHRRASPRGAVCSGLTAKQTAAGAPARVRRRCSHHLLELLWDIREGLPRPGLRACVNSEVCSCASSNLCIHALLCKTASIL